MSKDESPLHYIVSLKLSNFRFFFGTNLENKVQNKSNAQYFLMKESIKEPGQMTEKRRYQN